VRTDDVVTWVEHHLDDRAEAVFLGGNGFLAAAAAEELERRTGRLVVSANRALLWAVLSTTDTA
jgi:maleate isomerase